MDILAIIQAYGSENGELAYSPDCDVNSDGEIGLLDIVITAGNYGKTDLLSSARSQA